VFIVGLLVGPAIGLLLGDVVIGARSMSGWAITIGLMVLALLLLVVPVLDLGLRIGLDGGLLIGVLVSRTPIVAQEGGFRV
jgi:hypothetical protein